MSVESARFRVATLGNTSRDQGFYCHAALNAPTFRSSVDQRDTLSTHPKAYPVRHYSAPTITVVGSVKDLTKNLNKIGTQKDNATEVIPNLNGSLVPD
jgi:hypothetical protein